MLWQEIEIFDEENELSLEDEFSSLTLEFFPDAKEFIQRMSIKADIYYRTEKYKYKISLDPIEVYARLVERCDEPPLEYKVKDGVVLESEILKNARFPEDDFIKELK